MLMAAEELGATVVPTADPARRSAPRGARGAGATVTAAAAVALMALGIASRAPLDVNGRDSVERTTTAASTTASQRQRDSVGVWRHVELLQVDARPLERSTSLGRHQPV